MKVVIIGGGVIGLCAAHYARARGHEVTVLSRDAELHPGCSVGNAGMIVPSHVIPLAAPGAVSLGLRWMANPESPFWIKPRLDWDLLDWGLKFWRSSTAAHVARAAPLLRDLHLASSAAFADLAARPGWDFGLVRKGLLMLCKTAHALDEEARAAGRARALGIPAEVLDARQTAALEPGVRMDILGSVYFPKDCHLSPGKFLHCLRTHLAERGVTFGHGQRVHGWRREGSRLVAASTVQGEISGDQFVLCSGVWSAEMARSLDLNLPMQAGKGYSVTLEQPRQLPALCAIFTEARVAVTPMGNALRFGGTMEMAGLNEAINPRRVRGIVKAVPRYFPEFRTEDFDRLEPWHGLRPCPPDGLPYLGRTRRFANLTIATGHAMMGLSLAPITGQLVAELISGETPSIKIDLLNPDRFA